MGPTSEIGVAQLGDMVQELARHWSDVFKNNPREEQDIANWLGETVAEEDRLRTSDLDWSSRRKDVRKALQCPGNSAPRPDGLPYATW